MQQNHDPTGDPESQPCGRTFAVDRGKEHHEQTQDQNVEHFVFHERQDAAEKNAKKNILQEEQTVGSSFVLSISERGKVSRSLKCDRIGERW